ncbi:hypothetical protein BDZ89DRAFT_347748 [Hymenopellis radicata]|nr:hypothetical protein BDZ89DRAFT_347748 [Hymenopellis radicata]
MQRKQCENGAKWPLCRRNVLLNHHLHLEVSSRSTSSALWFPASLPWKYNSAGSGRRACWLRPGLWARGSHILHGKIDNSIDFFEVVNVDHVIGAIPKQKSPFFRFQTNFLSIVYPALGWTGFEVIVMRSSLTPLGGRTRRTRRLRFHNGQP